MDNNNNMRMDRGDLILAPGESAFILDGSKGNVSVAVGPTKTSLSDTDRVVLFDEKTRSFTEASSENVKQKCVLAAEDWYTVLQNPTKDRSHEHPIDGKLNDLQEFK